MVSMNKSFLYGICVASFTWIICVYLYIQLNNSENIRISSIKSNYISSKQNAIIDTNLKFEHSRLGKESPNNYKNSDQLIRHLQPISLYSVSKHEQMIEGSGLDELSLVRTPDEQRIKDEGYKIHAFNVLISNKLSLHRQLPDTRNVRCKSIIYPDNLPSSSIIICFYNEHYSTLLRTIQSVIDKTPRYLLREIILIDDYSDINNLHKDIEYYIAHNFDDRVKLYRTERREGLIRARIFGARKASGEVVVFLDSHIEVNNVWLEPLVARIKENRTNVAVPVIDIINADTFVYTASPLVRGGFNWGLHFKWENLPKGTLSTKEDFIKPIKSPTMAGGLFAMDRTYFKELGEYDAFMNIWGGENLEISFRIWMCGGHLELIPCSRIGHVFRQRRPYGAPDGQDTMLYNSLRVAHVWMDDYKDYFLKQRTESKNVDFGDVTSRIQLRKELKCNDFDWYLKNIYPELTLPSDNEARLKQKWSALERDQYQPWHSRKRNYISQFQIRLTNTTLCIQSAKDITSRGTGIILRPCNKTKTQSWFETDKHELVLSQLLCLQAEKRAPILYKCHEVGGDQEWNHKGEDGTAIYNLAAGLCLGVSKSIVNAAVNMVMCTDPGLKTWDFIK